MPRMFDVDTNGETSRMSRRALLGGAAASAALVALTTTAKAATTVTYTVNYAGDFTSLQAALNGVGTDFTTTSTGHVTGISSSSSVIQLATSEGSTKDFTGHPLTITGLTTCLITSYNKSTQVATVSARAGYPANFGSTPTTGTAYTISDVAVVFTFGQSASGNNLWTDTSSGIVCPTIGMDATRTLTINGATNWTSTVGLGFNQFGAANLPVVIVNAGSVTLFTFPSGVFVTLNNIQISVRTLSTNPIVSNDGTLTMNGVWVQAICDHSIFSNSGTWTLNNCIMVNDGAGFVFYNKNVQTLTNCAIIATSGNGFDSTSANTATCYFGYTPGGLSGSYTHCASNLSGVSGVIQLTQDTQFGGFYSDLRPVSGSGLIAAGGAGLATDIYGAARSGSACTIGPVEVGITRPTIQSVAYAVAWNGDVVNPAPSGTISSFSWSAGVATITTTAPHGMLVGITGSLATNNHSTSSGFLSNGGVPFTATVTGSSTFTFPLVSNPGSSPTGTSYWLFYIFNALIGQPTGSLPWFSTGACPSTAADNSHIVLNAFASPYCVGHPIQRNSDSLCLIVAFNAATGVAMVAAMAGFAGTFSGTPQSGDTYTIYPIKVQFNIGNSTSGGSRFWSLNVLNAQNAAIVLGGGMVNTLCSLTLQGNWLHNKNVSLGVPADNGSAAVIRNGDGTSGIVTSTAVLSVLSPVTVNDLQLWAGSDNDLGALIGNCPGGVSFIGASGYFINRCTLRGDALFSENDLFFEDTLSNPTPTPPVFTNCVFVGVSSIARHLTSLPCFVQNCSSVFTHNIITTTVGSTPAGSSSVVVASAAGIVAGMTMSCGTAIGNPGNNYQPSCGTPSGTTIPLAVTVTLSTIANGTPILFSYALDHLSPGQNGIGSSSMRSSAFFGAGKVYLDLSGPPASSVTNLTDSNSASYSGFSIASYPASFIAGSGAGAAVDLRLPPGSPLIGVGTYDASVPTDIFGQTRPNPPSVGAAELVASGSAPFFFHAAPL